MSDSSCWSLSAAGASSGCVVVVAPGAAALISAQGPSFGDDVCGLPVGCAGAFDRIRPLSATIRSGGLRGLCWSVVAPRGERCGSIRCRREVSGRPLGGVVAVQHGPVPLRIVGQECMSDVQGGSSRSGAAVGLGAPLNPHRRFCCEVLVFRAGHRHGSFARCG